MLRKKTLANDYVSCPWHQRFDQSLAGWIKEHVDVDIAHMDQLFFEAVPSFVDTSPVFSIDDIVIREGACQDNSKSKLVTTV